LSPPTELWRVFPWDSKATPGEPFSPSFVPRPTGRGRFHLPRDLSFVLYLAETPDHAVGEALQPWRGRSLTRGLLTRSGLPLSLVRVSVPEGVAGELANLCDPDLLSRLALPPDQLSSRHRWLTQPLSQALWEHGYSGLRWWSTFWGDWHMVVLFTARMSGRMEFGESEVLTLDSPSVVEAARLLGMERV
jgi:hypothetical protein